MTTIISGSTSIAAYNEKAMTNETDLRAALEDANLRYHEYAQAKEMWEGQKALAEHYGVADSPDVETFRNLYIEKMLAFQQANNRVMALKCETTNEA